jgi:hypothetical protein
MSASDAAPRWAVAVARCYGGNEIEQFRHHGVIASPDDRRTRATATVASALYGLGE